MLVLSPLRDINDERQREMESFSIGGGGGDEFPDFSGGNFLDSIDFDDLFVGINDGDLLPDLEMETEILAEFSLVGGEGSEVSNTSISAEKVDSSNSSSREEVDNKTSSASEFGCSNQRVEDDDSKPNEYVELNGNFPNNKSEKGEKLSSKQSKHPLGKRKFKVDWTPELHRRFVQAVDQLGVDKAVPSRILELMGIDCLTRHNIASHLQKYRSHRKHLLAKEAEAASWNQRRQMYGGATISNSGGKRDINPWVAPPTIGFPPMAPQTMSHVRPLHVWGHPSVDQSMLLRVWPKHMAQPPPPRAAAWTPHSTSPPPAHPSFWQGYHQHRIPSPMVQGIPPPKLFKVVPGVGVPKLPLDFQPSKESIDAAIGDVLSKPSLPLPLRLKPPSVDSVLGELQRQGVSKVPPSTCV